MENNALIVIEKLNPVEIFQEGGMGKVLAEIETKATAIVADVETEDGRKEIASVAYKVARSKTLIDDVGKAMVADWKNRAKVVDAARKEARDFLDALKDRVRAPLTEWEAVEAKAKAEEAERERQKNLKRVSDLQAVGKVVDIVAMAMLTDAEYEDVFCKAKAEYQAEQDRLAEEAREREAEAKRLADERAELEKLRAEQAEAQAKMDADRRAIEAERAKIEAEKKAEQERRDREEFERQAKIRAEQDAKEKVEREAKEAEARRIASEKAAEEKRLEEEAEKARQETMKPDKEKLLAFADKIHALTGTKFDLANDESMDVMAEVVGELMDTESDFRVYIERL